LNRLDSGQRRCEDHMAGDFGSANFQLGLRGYLCLEINLIQEADSFQMTSRLSDGIIAFSHNLHI